MSLHSLSLSQLVTVGVSEVADSGVLVVAAGAAGGARYRCPGSASVWAELIDNCAPDDLEASNANDRSDMAGKLPAVGA
jgi:hypothetical protein